MSSVPLVICNADCKPVAMLGVVPNGSNRFYLDGRYR